MRLEDGQRAVRTPRTAQIPSTSHPASRDVSGVPEGFYAHFASVHDLERMLAHCWQGSMFDLLERKRLGTESHAELDFHDWLTIELDPAGARAAARRMLDWASSGAYSAARAERGALV